MTKTIEQLQAELDREKEYTTKLNRQIDRLREQLRDRIPVEEHQKMLDAIRREYQNELSEIKNQQARQHNERGAGRKKKATKQVILRVLELRAEGLSQANISKAVEAELGVTISRTTVGEIVRGEHGDGMA